MIWATTDSVACNTCGRLFKPELEDELQDDGSVKRLFRCVRCGWEFPVARISSRGLELTVELQDTPIKDTKRIAEIRKALKKEVTRWAE